VIATAFFIWRLEREQKCLNPKILLQSLKIRVIIYQIHHIQWMDNEVLPQIGSPIVDLLISGGLFFLEWLHDLGHPFARYPQQDNCRQKTPQHPKMPVQDGARQKIP